MTYDLAAAIAEADAGKEPTGPFRFNLGKNADGKPQEFEIAARPDLLAMEHLGNGEWAACLRKLLGQGQFDRFIKALESVGQRLTLPVATTFLDAYMEHSKTTAGESEASTTSSPNTATQ